MCRFVLGVGAGRSLHEVSLPQHLVPLSPRPVIRTKLSCQVPGDVEIDRDPYFYIINLVLEVLTINKGPSSNREQM